MSSFLRLFCYMALIGLLGCQGMRQNVLTQRAVAQCNITCMQHFEFCKKNCKNNCPTCSAASQRKATKDFEEYVHEQQVEGKKVMRELNSYRDPLQCRKITCDCMADMAICKQSCIGEIPKKLQIVPNCI